MKEEYVSPEVRVVKCHVEGGFYGSEIPGGEGTGDPR